MDLNRNFPCGWEDYVGGDDVYQPWDFDYKGPLPGSEPETQIVMRLMEETQARSACWTSTPPTTSSASPAAATTS